MAGAGYRDFAAGAILTAAQVDNYLQEQTVMVFATAAARDSALTTVKSEGMFAFLLDSNTLTVYSGAAWSTVGPAHGALTAWTPTWTQSATITKTIQQANYSRVGRQITCNFYMTATSAGTAANPILFGVPVAAAANVTIVGSITVFDASAAVYTVGTACMQSTTTFGILRHTGVGVDANLSGAQPIASGDIAWADVHYESAADA